VPSWKSRFKQTLMIFNCDQELMCMFHQHDIPLDKLHLNWCRMYLSAIWLSNICEGDGKAIWKGAWSDDYVGDSPNKTFIQQVASVATGFNKLLVTEPLACHRNTLGEVAYSRRNIWVVCWIGFKLSVALWISPVGSVQLNPFLISFTNVSQ